MLRLPSPPFCRVRVMAYRKKDIASDVDPAAPWRDVPQHRPVTYRVTHYPAGRHIAGHKHLRHQLVYAISGLMVVRSEVGRWVVPSTRAIWMPAGMPVHRPVVRAAVAGRTVRGTGGTPAARAAAGCHADQGRAHRRQPRWPRSAPAAGRTASHGRPATTSACRDRPAPAADLPAHPEAPWR
ncbi:hypothetical protein G6F63_014260 [Rhizopus arrhizus]|nr:hypothetical protein G6F63_014260 [Rhizopus arrhizus]